MVIDLRAPVDRVVEVLTTNPASVIQPDARPDARATGRFRCGLTIEVADGATLRHEVDLQVGRITRTSGGVTLGLHLEPVAHRHLVPVFDGELEATAAEEGSQLVLKGGYTVPFGVIGRLGDALKGHRSVEQSLERLVTEVAQRLEAEAGPGVDTGPPTAVPAAAASAVRLLPRLTPPEEGRLATERGPSALTDAGARLGRWDQTPAPREGIDVGTPPRARDACRPRPRQQRPPAAR